MNDQGKSWTRYLDGEMRKTMAGIGLWIDSSEQTAEETIEDILQQLYSSSL